MEIREHRLAAIFQGISPGGRDPGRISKSGLGKFQIWAGSGQGGDFNVFLEWSQMTLGFIWGPGRPRDYSTGLSGSRGLFFLS